MNYSRATRVGLITISLLIAIVPLLSLANSHPDERYVPTCPNLARNLSFGSRGQDVTELQTFLIAEGDLAAGNNTGYFGRMTEAAVKSWQAKNGVVSSGTPSTTGFGAVGPRTRAKIASLCGGVGAQPQTSMNIDLDKHRYGEGQFRATIKATAPLKVHFTAHPVGQGLYYIGFGDTFSSDPHRSPEVTCTANVFCAPISASHTYTNAGTYYAGLVREYDAGYPQGSVIDSAADVIITLTGADPSRLAASPSGGSAPLEVVFTASVPVNQGLKCTAMLDGTYSCPAIVIATTKVVFGDGEEYRLTCKESDADPQTGHCLGPHALTHTYREAGTYVAKLLHGYGYDEKILGEVVVTVR